MFAHEHFVAPFAVLVMNTVINVKKADLGRSIRQNFADDFTNIKFNVIAHCKSGKTDSSKYALTSIKTGSQHLI